MRSQLTHIDITYRLDVSKLFEFSCDVYNWLASNQKNQEGTECMGDWKFIHTYTNYFDWKKT